MTNRIPTQDVTPPPKKKSGAETNQGQLYAAREHIYVKRIKGFFQRFRLIASSVLLTLFYLGAFINYEGRQAIFFDLPNRQFHIFSTTIFPHDFMLLAWILIILAFVLFFVTNFAGRVWCGYSCPQFVWTWIYIWIEELTEGNANRRKKLNAAPWNKDKIVRKTAKHTIWLLIALATGIAFIGYFSPIRDLIPRVFTFNLGPWEFFWLGFFIFFTYLFAGWLREQVCIYMCPYARFQSVMFDKDTLVVSYNPAKGEPRGRRRKDTNLEEANLGYCIDCDLCVQVCPVGIDIRDGLQYECVTCAACIDACDEVMLKMGYPKGLISYTTEEELAGRETKIIRPRLLGYFGVLAVMVVAFIIAVSGRVPLELEVLRDRHQLVKTNTDGTVENSYLIRIANMEQRANTYHLTLKNADGLQLASPSEYKLDAGEVRQYPITILANPQDLPNVSSMNIEVHIEALDNPGVEKTRESRFIIRVGR